MKFEWDLSELTKFADNLSQTTKFEREIKFAAKEIASVLLKQIKALTPIGDTYQLVNGWNGNDFAVRQVDGGFEVLLINKDEKAIWVNDGHKVRNRKDGDYLKVKHRVKVKSPHQWQNPVSDWYVFGHFFVERGILQLTNTSEIERIIMTKLQKWWESV